MLHSPASVFLTAGGWVEEVFGVVRRTGAGESCGCRDQERQVTGISESGLGLGPGAD